MLYMAGELSHLNLPSNTALPRPNYATQLYESQSSLVLGDMRSYKEFMCEYKKRNIGMSKDTKYAVLYVA